MFRPNVATPEVLFQLLHPSPPTLWRRQHLKQFSGVPDMTLKHYCSIYRIRDEPRRGMPSVFALKFLKP
jgi:hypothetical protein